MIVARTKRQAHVKHTSSFVASRRRRRKPYLRPPVTRMRWARPSLGLCGAALLTSRRLRDMHTHDSFGVLVTGQISRSRCRGARPAAATEGCGCDGAALHAPERPRPVRGGRGRHHRGHADRGVGAGGGGDGDGVGAERPHPSAASHPCGLVIDATQFGGRHAWCPP